MFLYPKGALNVSLYHYLLDLKFDVWYEFQERKEKKRNVLHILETLNPPTPRHCQNRKGGKRSAC